MTRGLASLLGIMLVGCHPGAGSCEEVEGVPSLELGTGERRYEPIPSDGVLEAVYGPQGGRHVWISLRTTGIWPGLDDGDPDDDATVTMTLVDLDDDTPADALFQTWIEPVDRERAEQIGVPWEFDYVYPAGSGAHGEVLPTYGMHRQVTVTVTDACGQQADDSVDITIAE